MYSQVAFRAVAALILAASAAQAQSLADVARQEAERRKAVTSSGKVYTNDTLRAEPPPSTPPPVAPAAPPAAEPAPAAAPPCAPASPAPAGGAPATPPAPQTEADWRTRVATARDALARAQTFAEALQSRINALTTDFVNRDDPSQRDVIATERQKALAELERVKQEIGQQQKAIAAIQDEARRAGVPAGWVR